MGTETDSSDTQKIKCQVCRQIYTTACDYRQGRCPHHPPVINLQRLRKTNNARTVD